MNTTLLEHDVAAEMRDGTQLRADIWRPDDPLPRPVVLMRTPYGKAGFAADTLRPEQCVRAGYVCVLQESRGRGGSGGQWTPFNWDTEAQDTYDSVEWAARQPWCDGNVVMAGASYLGIVQWLGAAAQPPHLRAIAPAMTTSAQLDRVAAGGAVRLNQTVMWLALTTLGELDPVAEAEEVAGLMGLLHDPTAALRRRPVGDIPELGQRSRLVLSSRQQQVEAYDYGNIGVPTLSVGGWFDIFCAATVESFQRVQRANPGDHRLVMGPWTHDGRLPAVQGALNFGPWADAGFCDIAGQHLRFFGAQLGEGEHDAPRVRYFLMGANEWRGASQWPPAECTARTWLLGSEGNANSARGDGTLALRRRGAAAEDRWTHDPDDPVDTHGGRVLAMGKLVAGPVNRAHIQARGDVLCYTSPALDADVDVVGAVCARLFVSTSAHDGDVLAKLVDVHPDGVAIAFAEGIQRLGAVDPGEVSQLDVELGPTAWRVPAGHRLRLEIAGSDFPQFDSNTATGNPPGTDQHGVVATQRIHHSALRPSRIDIDILGG